MRSRALVKSPKQPKGGLWTAACDLVDRARAGDQNAMAILARVGENARKGELRAKMTASMVRRYVKERPADMGFDSPPAPIINQRCLCALANEDKLIPALRAALKCQDGEKAAVVVLANGQYQLTNGTIQNWGLSCFGSDDATEQFYWGIRLSSAEPHEIAPNASEPFAVGRIVGQARAIQAVRMGKPIALLSQAAAWELGEAA